MTLTEQEAAEKWCLCDELAEALRDLFVAYDPVVRPEAIPARLKARAALSKVRVQSCSVAEKLRNLEREVEVLRQYGNKDCTAMADAALAAHEGSTVDRGGEPSA